MDKPLPKIAPCPNKECENGSCLPHIVDSGPGGHQVRFQVSCDFCAYFGPGAPTESEAIRLHNALAAPTAPSAPVVDTVLKASIVAANAINHRQAEVRCHVSILTDIIAQAFSGFSRVAQGWQPMDKLPPDHEDVILSITDEDDGAEILYAASYDYARKRWTYQGSSYDDEDGVVTFEQKNGWMLMPKMFPPAPGESATQEDKT